MYTATTLPKIALIWANKTGLENIRSGDLDEKAYEDNYFDAVSLISVAAHLTDPMDMFRRIDRILRPGGLLLIWTVNAGSGLHKLSQNTWWGFTGNHVVFFDRHSMSRALTEVGFSKVEFGYNNFAVDWLRKSKALGAEQAEYFETLFRENGMEDMLAVVATK